MDRLTELARVLNGGPVSTLSETEVAMKAELLGRWKREVELPSGATKVDASRVAGAAFDRGEWRREGNALPGVQISGSEERGWTLRRL